MTQTDGLKDVETLINRFGGMRPMARKMDIPVSTIQGWKNRDLIPSDRVSEVVKAAKANQVSMQGYDLSGANENVKANSQSPKHETHAETPSAVKPKVMGNTNFQAKQNMDISKIKRDIVKRSVITSVSIVAVLAGLGYVLFGQEAQDVSALVENQTQVEQKYNSFEQTVTDGLNNLNDQIVGIAAAVGIERNSNGEVILYNDLSISERVTALESRLRASGADIDLGQLVSKFENLSSVMSGQTGDSTAAMTDLKSIVDALQARMATLDATLEQAKADNADMAKSLENVSGRDLSAAAMLLAMTQMRDSLNRAQPFAEDLAILQNLVGEEDPELTAAINRLAPYAENGVLSPEGLSSELRGLSGEIIAAALRGEDVSIQDRIMTRIGQVLSIQKDGEPVMGIAEQAIVAKAQKALDNGDIKTALAELNKLEGEAATAASPLTSEIQGAVNADQTISKMMEVLLQKLQNPAELQSTLKNLPAEIQKQMQGEIKGSAESGLIILE